MNPAELVTATLGAFTAFLPSVVAVRHHDPDDVRRASDTRLGLLIGGVISFALAAYYAEREDSAKPLIIWLGAAGAIVLMYEAALRSRNDIDLRGHGDRS